MQDITLRDATDADIARMHELDVVCFEEPFRFDLRSMRGFVREAGAITIVAEAGGGICGFVLANAPRRGSVASAYLTTLDVHPEHRRSGLARRLVAAAERRVAQAGATFVTLHVYLGNSGAICFYEAMGYGRVGLAEDFYGEGLDAWVYGKALK